MKEKKSPKSKPTPAGEKLIIISENEGKTLDIDSLRKIKYSTENDAPSVVPTVGEHGRPKIVTLEQAAEECWAGGTEVLEFIQGTKEKYLKIPKPLPLAAREIYEKLCSLKPTEAMTLPQIQNWWYEKTGKNLDDGTWKKYRKVLEPWGLKNEPRVGYYIKK